jgi:hypothetical protein
MLRTALSLRNRDIRPVAEELKRRKVWKRVK